MILNLEVCGQEAASLGAACRKEFPDAGGTIGRLPDNDWVLPGEYVSGHHALIQFRNGQFFVEDTSTNGVFVNSPGNRLQRGRPCPLNDGDHLFIASYEIEVAVSAGEGALEPFASTQGGGSWRGQSLIPDDPFASDADERAPATGSGTRSGPRNPFGDTGPFAGITDAAAASDEADPLKALGLEDRKSAPPARAPRASDLVAGSPLSDHYSPPRIRQDTEPALARRRPAGAGRVVENGESGAFIPSDYDPLAPERPADASSRLPSARPVPGASARPAPGPTGNRAAAPSRQPTRPTPGSTPARPQAEGRPRAASSVAANGSTVAVAQTARQPAPRVAPSSTLPGASPEADFDFRSFLEGAGLQGVDVSPELARNFGEILCVVIGGLMDILRARERVKDEFRLRVTTFKATDNNPLKFSANVEDALHNLLVKRNPAYLDPVAAFEDAFRDLRNHQVAILAGIRAAYEGMLARFDPEKLQAEFDRQKKGKFLGGPAKLKYWDLYGERFRDRLRDADSCFRDLFGDEFAKAYEQQLARLRMLDQPGDE